MADKSERILRPDQFEVTEQGEVIIKDKEIAKALAEAKAKGPPPGEQGITLGIIVKL